MRALDERTLLAVRDEMAALCWSDADIAGLVDPGHGVISGLQQLLQELDRLRRGDLGMVAPAEAGTPDDTSDAGV